MLSNKMDTLVRVSYPLNEWDKKSIRPGPVGSVGDCLTGVRLQQSTPEMAIKYSKTFSGKNEPLRGSNVQDGDWASFSSGGFNAVVKRRKIYNPSSFKTPVGWKHQDAVPPARTVEPKVAEQGRQGFETQAAAILYKSGSMFGELPGGYSAPAGVLPRGGMNPRVITGGADNTPPTTRPDFVSPMEKRPLPNTGGLIQSIVNNLLPTPANNLNGRKDPALVQYLLDQAALQQQNGGMPVAPPGSGMLVDG